MLPWQRRSLLTTCAALATGSALATVSASGATTDETSAHEVSDGWWTSRGDAGNTAFVRSDGLDAPDTIAWQYVERGVVVVADETVYLRTRTSEAAEVHALDAADGSVQWVAEAGEYHAAATLSVVGDAVYVGGDRVTALDADTGDTRWQREFDETPDHQFVAFATVYVTVDETLYALDVGDGSIRWERDAVTIEQDDGDGREYTLEALHPLVAADSDTIYAAVASDDNEHAIAALDPETGDTRWTSIHDEYTGRARGLAVSETRLILQYERPREEPRVFVFDLDSREFQGHISRGEYRSLSAVDDVTVTGSNHQFSGHDVSTVSEDHSSEWSAGSGFSVGAPVIAGDTVVTTTAFGEDEPEEDGIIGFDLENGGETWRFTFDDVQWGERDSDPVPSPVVDTDAVYVNRDDGLVAIRSARDGGEEDNADDGDEDEAGDGDDSVDEDPCCEDDDDGKSDEDGGEDGDETGNTGEDDDSAGDGETGTDDDDDDGPGGNGDDLDENGDVRDDASDGRENETEPTDDDDSVPGFTTGAGVVGGAVTLEWLRRQTDTDEPTE